VEDPFGILAAVPLTWLASAAPLAWRNRPAEAREPLRAFLAATALLFLFSALPILLFYWNCSRYELEFLPPVVLLAVIGAFGVDRALAGHAAGRKWARAGGVALLAASVAFNLLAGVARRAQEDANLGAALFGLGRTAEAAEHYRTALRLAPGLAQAHDGLGLALVRMGQGPEAIAEFQAAVATAPGLADARTNLGNALAQSGRAADAVVQYAEVCRLEPESATAHYNLAYGWQLLGNRDAARAEYERASRLNPALARRAP
jgi:tetratricopeptide (TPR) repeat protein